MNETCPICGEYLEGDGYGVVIHCPNTEVDLSDKTPDDDPFYCEGEDE